MHLKEIGRIHSPYKNKGDAPRQGRASKEEIIIELHEVFKDGLKGLKKDDYILVIYWGDRANRDVLISKPPMKEEDYGVFASRSPNRPNPLAVNVAKILKIEDSKLTLVGLDALDGSPVLDIKIHIDMLNEV